MTRKDYIRLAGAIRDAANTTDATTNPDVLSGVYSSAYYIALALESENPRFDREHFMAVCRGEKALASRP